MSNLDLVAREAAPALAKAVAEAATKFVSENPFQTLAFIVACALGYQKGRADAFGEFLNFKRNSM